MEQERGQSDNCKGQNATIQYLMWWVMTGHHTSVELSFMLVGHTKFSPDRFFGLFKKAFCRSTIFEISRQVEVSTATGQSIPQLVRNMKGGLQVKFY